MIKDLFDKLKSFTNGKAQKTEPSHERTYPVILDDGTIEEFSEYFMIQDGIHGIVCQGKYYHTCIYCENFQWERLNCDTRPYMMVRKKAEKQGITFCANCSHEDYLFRHGRIDELAPNHVYNPYDEKEDES